MLNVSVIIPALNEEKYLNTILHDLSLQKRKPLEIIVVDGRSSDKTVSIAGKYSGVSLIKTHANPAHQRHSGAKKARGDILVFLDADTSISPDFIENIHQFFSHKPYSLACPLYVPSDNHIPSMVLYSFFNMIFFTVQKVFPSGAGSCIAVRRETYFELGGFNEQYTYDDMHFLSRAQGLGIFAVILERVVVSNRRIKKLGFMKSFLLYTKLSWYFIRRDYAGANTIVYPFEYTK